MMEWSIEECSTGMGSLPIMEYSTGMGNLHHGMRNAVQEWEAYPSWNVVQEWEMLAVPSVSSWSSGTPVVS